MHFDWINRRYFPYIVIFSFYTVAWGAILLEPQSMFWDDWTLFGAQSEYVLSAFDQSGLPEFGYLHLFMTRLGPLAYHVGTYLSFLAIGFLFLSSS